MRVIPRHEQFINRFLVSSALTGVALVISLVAAGASAHAADSPAKVTVKVDEACSMSGHVDTEHTLTNPTIGAWNPGIGTTSITAVCNDAGGYDVYAVGYSNDEWKNTNLINTTDSSVTIGTRNYDSSYTSSSYWSMQLSQGTGDKATIVSPYSNYSAVPSDYIKVATYPSNTTGASGSSFKTTYGVYIANSQAIGTYQGQVKYTLVHPNGADAPEAKDPTPNIQDFTATMCQAQASTSDVTVTDSRDGKEYTVRYINGACWMTQNLRYVGDAGSSSGSMVMKSDTSNISADTTISYTDLTAGNTYDEARIHVATDDQVPSGATYTATDIGVWYNYAAASAMTITTSSNSTVDTYNVCPKNWTLPSYSTDGTVAGNVYGLRTAYSAENALAFSPITGGYYGSGSLSDTGYGYWWSTTAGNATSRYLLYYNGSSTDTYGGNRQFGYYVRCVRTS